MIRKRKIHDIILCGCGCGRSKFRFDCNNRESLFIRGHNNKFKRFAFNYKGGITINRGYKYIFKPDHHYTHNGYVSEHRLVWEEYNKTSLLKWADVHHINENKMDNRIDNLQAMMKSKHTQLHINKNGYVKNQFGIHKIKKR